MKEPTQRRWSLVSPYVAGCSTSPNSVRSLATATAAAAAASCQHANVSAVCCTGRGVWSWSCSKCARFAFSFERREQ